MPVYGCVHEIFNAFVTWLKEPDASPPMFKDAMSGSLFTQDQLVLVTPAKSDWRSTVMVAPDVCAVGAGRLSALPLLVKMENVRWEMVIGSKMFGGG
jgi:hypothetical protein